MHRQIYKDVFRTYQLSMVKNFLQKKLTGESHLLTTFMKNFHHSCQAAFTLIHMLIIYALVCMLIHTFTI